ncbi:MAG: DUF222 domain-containing protein [Actinomycetales bacterium]|nr:DUF222 domain-containing protein [Actinomycetales bacterium]
MFESTGVSGSVDALESSLRAHLRELLTASAGGVLAAAVEDLLAENLTELDDDGVLDLVAAGQRMASWAMAAQLRAAAELLDRWTSHPEPAPTRRRPGEPTDEELAHRAVVTEIALTCGMSECASQARVSAAHELTARLPETLQALATGALDWPKVQAIVATTTDLDSSTARAVQAAVLPAAGRQNVPALRRSLARAVIDADPAGADRRHQQQRRQRQVICTPLPEGMGEVWACLPATGMLTVQSALDRLAAASRTPGDHRSADQRRADAFVDVFAETLATATGQDTAAVPSTAAAPPRTPPRGPRRPAVVVTVPLATLTGLARDAADSSPGTTHPTPSTADLAGYGPVPPAAVRDLLATGTWRCAAVDDRHGTLQGLGTSTFTPTYRPGRATERHLALRDGTCSFPGCHQPTRRCDLDHRTPYPHGPTCECNLITLCRHHHLLKHRGGYRVRASTSDADPPGTLIWTTPLGRNHRREPVPLAPPRRQPGLIHAPPAPAAGVPHAPPAPAAARPDPPRPLSDPLPDDAPPF